MKTSRRPRARTIAVLLVTVVLLGAAAWLAYFSPYLVVRKVVVSGQQQLQTEQVLTAVQVPMGTPLALQDVDAIALRATTLRPVQAASVTRSWPDTIRVTITERRPLLAIRQADGDFVLVDREGVAYADSALRPDGVMLAEVNPADRLLLAQVGVVATTISDGLGRKVSTFGATNSDRISLKLKSGVTVNWGSATDSALKADIVTALLKSKRTASIDVSSPHNPAAR
jgi:cell division protein FtsQ